MKQEVLISIYITAIVAFSVVLAADVNLKQSRELGTGCKCANADCGCCLHLDVPKIGINDTGCVNLTYLKQDYGIQFSFSLDGKIIIKEEISARNPPPVCFGIPHLQKEASICLDFYDLNVKDKLFSGCVQLEARLYHVIEEDVKLGCFKLKIPGKYRDKYREQMEILKRIANAKIDLAEMKDLLDLKQIQARATGCQCINTTCGCCLDLNIPKILHDTACVNFTYLVQDYGIAFTFSWDGKIIIKEEISARNPPPICFGIPKLEKEASICLVFYDLDVKAKVFSGCVKLEIRLLFVKLLDVNLGCFKIPGKYNRRHREEMVKLIKIGNAKIDKL